MLDVVRHNASLALLTALALASCGPISGGASGAPALPSGFRTTTASPIKHVIIVVQENRSFDDLFATFPGADGATQGLMKTSKGDVPVPLQKVDLGTQCDPGHGYSGFLQSLDNGKMDGFALKGNSAAAIARDRTNTSIRSRSRRIGDRAAVRAGRPDVRDARQRQFYRASGSDRGRDDDRSRIRRRAWSTFRRRGRGAATRRRHVTSSLIGDGIRSRQ